MSAMGAGELFAGLAALAREEYALVSDERFEELAELQARRDDLMAALPATAPPEALDDLREAARLQGLVTAALREAREATGTELRRLRHTRTGVQGYAAGTGAPAAARAAFDAAC
jgi:crotonobetainyl-CoA:carnitine CoA-transferase CaiB-like acyl-CoA transferase